MMKQKTGVVLGQFQPSSSSLAGLGGTGLVIYTPRRAKNMLVKRIKKGLTTSNLLFQDNVQHDKRSNMR